MMEEDSPQIVSLGRRMTRRKRKIVAGMDGW
jgi:hypothetical protein